MKATSPAGCSLSWVLPFRESVGLRRLCSSAPACSVLFNSLRPSPQSSSYRAWLFPASKSLNCNGPKQSISQAAFFFSNNHVRVRQECYAGLEEAEQRRGRRRRKKLPVSLLLKAQWRDFPGGPVANTPLSQFRGHRFGPCLRN